MKLQNKEGFVGILSVCEHFDISKETVYRWVKSKKIPHYKIGRQLRFKISEVEKKLCR